MTASAQKISNLAERRAIMDEFHLTPGWWVLNENTVRGEAPRGKPSLLELYKNAEALRKRAYYILLKRCVVTPFGYWIDDASRKAFEDEISECQETAEAYNELLHEEFKCLINFLYIRTDPADPVYRRRMAEFAIERLEDMEEKLRTMDPKRNEKMLQYTQDRTKRLDVCYTGNFARVIKAAAESGRDLVNEIRKSPSLQQSLDVSAIETAKHMLRKALEIL